MKKRISARLVKSIQPASRPYEIRDTLLKGFILRVQPTGTKPYLCEYARAIARNTIAEYQINGTVIPKSQPSAPTLAFFINFEYAPWQLANNGSGHEEIDRIRRHFLPTLGNKHLNEITPLAVEHWRIRRLKSGILPTTANRPP